jgi:hypothetical protein
MNNEAPAAAPVESAPTTIAFDAGDQNTWSREQRDDWNKTGNIPAPPKQDSAPAAKEDKKKTPPAESAPAKETTDAAGAEPAKEQEYKARTEKRFNELLSTVKKLEADLAEAKKPRETAAPPTAPKAKSEKELAEEYFKANPGKSYEDFLAKRAREIAEDMLKERDRKAAEAAVQKDLSERMTKLKERYPDADKKVFPTIEKIMTDKGIPEAVQIALSDSPMMEDLLYVLSDESTIAHFIETAKSTPLKAVRLIFQMEQDIKSEREKGGSGKVAAVATEDTEKKETPPRGEDGKFQKTPEETKPRAPKPPSEVGGKGSAPDDALRTAAQANDFRAFEAEENRRKFASK